jgi:competence transcription factor ComK
LGESVSFTGGSTDSTIEITEYTWSVEGYGPIGYQSSFTTNEVTRHPGTYTVTLQVKSKDGVWSELAARTLTVLSHGEISKPVAVILAISPNPATVGDSVSFTGSSSDSAVEITEYLWKIVDYNLTDSRKSFTTSTVTQKAGTYAVTLLIKSKDGIWSDPVTETLTVLPEKDTRKPVAVISVISPNPATVGDSVTFTGSSSDATIVITEYLWSIVSLNLTDSRKTFTTSTVTQKAGTYSVTFKIKSKDGIWSDIVTKTLTVVPVTTSCTCDTVCTCVGHCTCDTVCTCQSHGGTFCTCDMVHYWYPN